MGLVVTTVAGTWAVDDTPMICPAWSILNLQVLWQGPSVAIANRQQAGGVGEKGYPPIVTASRLSVRFAIVGDVDIDGVPTSDPYVGFQENIDYLRANVFDPTDPLRTSTLTMPNGDIRTAEIQFDPLPLDGAISDSVETTLSITLPGGVHTSIYTSA